jgi:hypothetical protein
MMRLAVDEVLLPLALCNNIDDIMWTLDKLFVQHSERYQPKQYCINIKVYSLALTRNQEMKALAKLEQIWDEFINPWIADFRADTGYQIYSQGRSGGYLYVDQVSQVLDGDEELADLQGKIENLLKFHTDWQTLLKDIKAALNRMRMPKEGAS